MGQYSKTSAAAAKPPFSKTMALLLEAVLDHFKAPQSAEDVDDPAFPLDPVYDYPKHSSLNEVSAPCVSVRTVWIGHASTYTLFPTSDPNRPFGVLTDPVFTKSCSPIGWPRRRVGIPFGVEGLGPIDAVVISHNHYDHLDKDSIRMIEAASHTVKYFVPLGLGKWFTNKGRGIPADRVIELDWWEGVTLGGLQSGFEMLGRSCGFDKLGQIGHSQMVTHEDQTWVKRNKPSKSGLEVDMESEKDIDVEEDFDIITKVDLLGTLADSAEEIDGKLNESTSRAALNEPNSPSFTITCTPAQHSDGRDLFFRDKGETKCATWVIEQHPYSKSPTKTRVKEVQGCKMFFGGDTGYRTYEGDSGADFVQAIRDRFGPFNLCLIPAASGSLSSRFNLPDSLVRYMHAMPPDTIDMHKVLTESQTAHPNPANSKTTEKSQLTEHKAVTIAIHHTTFDSRKGAERTMRVLRDARRDRGRLSSAWTDGAAVTLQPGEWKDMADL